MLKKLLGATLILAAMAAAANAETIAEYDFGKEVLRLQAEEGFACEYEAFADKIRSSGTWDGGKALYITSDYSELPADDADGKLTYTYTFNAPYAGKYRIFMQEAGVDAYYHSQSDWEIDGVAAAKKKTNNNAVDITRINYIDTELTAGKHTISVNIPKAAKGGRFYYALNYISFHYYYDINNNFTSMGMYDLSQNAVYGPSYGEFVRFNGSQTGECYAEFDVSAPAAGSYIVNLEAQQLDNSGISRFEVYVNGEKAYTKEQLPRYAYGQPACASASNDRQYLRTYYFRAKLNSGENKIKLVALKEGSNQWLLIDRLTVSSEEQAETDKVRVDGENALNLSEVYSRLSHGSAKLVGYKDFSGGIAAQTYGTTLDGQGVELKYTVNAPKTGLYNMGIFANGAGSDFDVTLDDSTYSAVRSNSTRTANAIAAANSKAAADMYLYSYNYRVYLKEGINEMTVTVQPRSEDGQYIVDLDYFDFNFKEEGELEPRLELAEVTYNGGSTAPEAGSNTVGFTVKNTTPAKAENVMVYAAVYDADMLTDVKIGTLAAVAANSSEQLEIENLNFAEGNTVKIFIWDTNNKPFFGAVEY